jgi:glycosyltransferase involved in cell wall biosynthesis
MTIKNYLLVYRDVPLTPGAASGGAEMATHRLAQYLARAGNQVVIAGILQIPHFSYNGVEYWSYGSDYKIEEVFEKAKDRWSSFHLLAVGNAFPLVFARSVPQVATRVFVCHDRHASDAGFSLPLVSKLSQAFCVVSEAHKSEVVQKGADPSTIHILYNGVDLETFTPVGNVPRDPYKVIFAGALVQDKGLHVLLQAYSQLKPRIPQLTLDVYGSSAMWGRDPIFDQSALEAQLPGVTFKGAVNQTQLAQAYAGAGIFVFPSIWFECFPLSCLEAQASGCAVVAFDVGGVKEGIVNGVTGMVLPEISPESLIQAIGTLLSQPEKALGMGREGMLHIQKNFKWEHVAARVMSLCSSLHAEG